MQHFTPQPRLLMGPGPSDVSQQVLAAMSQPTVGHLDPQFTALMDSIKQLLQATFQTKNRLTIPISGPGSVGQETCVVNLIEPGDKAVVCVNGVFGGRLKQMIERCGGQVIAIEQPWGEPVDVDRVKHTLGQHQDARVLAFVHAETSTGARSDAAALCALARSSECLSIMDTVTGLGGIEVDVDSWGADAVYSGSQKCLSAPPGLSPVTFSARAINAIRSRKTPVQSWFMDLNGVMDYWDGEGGRSYHHTAPVNALYGLHEALLMLHEEGLTDSWTRHLENHHRLRGGLERLGLSLRVEASARLPQLNVVEVPAGVDEAQVRTRLLQDFNIEIGAGLGELAGKVWRVGLMGASSRPDKIERLLNALGKLL